MGSAVALAARARGWEVCRRFDSSRPLTSLTGPRELGPTEAIIDFSSSDVFVDHVRRCVEWGMPLVSGTTGLGDRLTAARALVESRSGSVLHSPNFSLGIAILRRALRASAGLVARLDQFAILIHEVHHAAKRDRPSGTALLLAEDILGAFPRDRITPEISAARFGSVIGEHTIRFESADDQILLQHTARSRAGFALGALEAAQWLSGRTGFFTLDDMLDDWAEDRLNLHPTETEPINQNQTAGS